MDEKRIAVRLNLKKSHAAALQDLALKEITPPARFIEEALEAYLAQKGVDLNAPRRTAEPVPPPPPDLPSRRTRSPGEEEEKSRTFDELFAGLRARAEDTSSLIVRIPTARRLWDFSDKANITVGKRTVSEIYDFKKFLALGEEQVQEFGLLKTWLTELKDDGRMIRSLEHKKEHSTVSVSTEEIQKGYETFRDGHYALVPCLDGTVSLLKTAILKTLLHRENVRKRTEVLVPCGETVVLLPSSAEAETLLHSFDALTNKLDRIADRIITEYKPIDLKWNRLQEEQMSGLRILHGILQAVVGGIIFSIITALFVTNPGAIVPIFFTDQPDAPLRSFIASYLLMMPALCVFFNYLVVYMIWFRSMEAGVRNRTRRAIDRDMLLLKHSIESEL